MGQAQCLLGVVRAFLSERHAHPEAQNEEGNEENLRKNERNYAGKEAQCLLGVVRAFLSERHAHPEAQNEEGNEENLRKK